MVVGKANQISEAPWFPSAPGTSKLKVLGNNILNKLRLVQGWRGGRKRRNEEAREGLCG